MSNFLTKGEITIISSVSVKKRFKTHYLLCHVLPQICKGVEIFSGVANSFVVDVSRKSVVPAALHVDGNQVDANLGVVKQVVFNLLINGQ